MRAFTLVKILVTVIAVILLFRCSPELSTPLLAASAGLSIISWILSFVQRSERGLWRSISVYSVIIAVAMLRVSTDRLGDNTSHDITMPTGRTTAIAIVDDFPKIAKSQSIRVSLLSLNNDPMETPLRLELYLPKDSTRRIWPQDTIVVSGTIGPTQHPADPYAFDYADHLAKDHIFHQFWAKDLLQHRPVDRYSGMDVLQFDLRKKYLLALQEHLDGDTYSIATALLLGYRKELDKEVQKEFARTGAIHVLAVSGLHVGIFIAIITYLLSWLPERDTRIKFLKSAFYLSGLFFYVYITGAGAPVIRSAVIFTLILGGKYFDKEYDSLNLLAGAALGMLFYDPNYLFQISFQLSFAAVSSIIIFYRHIYQLYRPGSWWDRKLWSMIAVSIAAQILIFPMSMFYFHQFPTYFILSSIVAILLAMIIICMSICFFLFPHFSIGGFYIADLIGFLVRILQGCISFFAELPGALVEKIWWTPTQLVIFCLFLLGLIGISYQNKFQWRALMVGSLSAFFIYAGYRNLSLDSQVVISQYETDEGLQDIIIGHDAYEVSTKALHWEKQVFLTKNFRMAHKAQSVTKGDPATIKRAICENYETH